MHRCWKLIQTLEECGGVIPKKVIAVVLLRLQFLHKLHTCSLLTMHLGVAQPGYVLKRQQPYGDSYASDGALTRSNLCILQTLGANNINAYGS
ncbi:hypothetical protein ACHQM5_009968 [Ranunculus cassubicifolius]